MVNRQQQALFALVLKELKKLGKQKKSLKKKRVTGIVKPDYRPTYVYGQKVSK
tara:strand:- start:279 stop:437 length:159 start_codon:yes stop_codon:yes gene_type:complete